MARELVKEVEAREDCFILGFDQTDVDASSDIKNLNQTLASDDVVSIVSEKGQMACRDYPHPRHNCWKYPFEKTSHENYCKLCY
ncbi:hypothetical protein Leryth_000220 [Lithospermum erythrorhizon]|nr:hypothetical protein Leryth_000220 [Lithospermum erythrorhizon]